MSENAVQAEQLVQPDLITSARTSLTSNDSEQRASNLSASPSAFQTAEPCTVPKHSLENSSSPAGTSGIDIASTSPSSTCTSTAFSMAFAPRANAESLYDRASSSTLRLRSPLNASSTSSSGYASDSATGDLSATASASASFAGASTSSSSSTSATCPTGAGTSSAPGAASASEETRNDFDCSICFDAAHDPVVSYCGHLFCWPCLHRWLETRGERAQCPVCKAAIGRERVIPVYGRNSTDRQDPRDKPQPVPTPPRPQPQRQEAPQEGPLGLGGLFGGPDLFGPGFNLSFGIGAFPFSLFWTSFNVGPGGAVRNPHARAGTELSREEQFVSRIFLVLAVIFLLWIIFF